MQLPKRARFGVTLLALLAVPLSARPWFGDHFVAMFADAANAWVDAIALEGNVRVRFERTPPEVIAQDATAAWDAHVVVMNDASHGDLQLHLRTAAYVPIALLLALAFASARPPRGRWRALALSLLGLAPFIAIRVGVPVLEAMVRWGFVSAGPFASVVLKTLYNAFDTLPCVPFAAPVLLWAMLFWWPVANLSGLADLVRTPTQKANARE